MNVHTAAAASTAIRTLDAAEAKTRLDELADILVDAVAHGASVNFMASFTHARGARLLAQPAAGHRRG